MIVRVGCDNGVVIETQLDPRQAMVACLDQWRRSIVESDDVELLTQVRDIEAMLRIWYEMISVVR